MHLNIHASFFYAILIGVLILAAQLFLPYLVTIAIAATTAVILHPLHEDMERWMGGRKIPAAILTTIFTVILILVPLTLLTVQIATQSANLYAQIMRGSPTLLGDVIMRVENLIGTYAPGASIDLMQYTGQALNWIAGSVGNIFAGTMNTVFKVFLGLLAYYYMLKDGEKFLRIFRELTPLTEEEDLAIQSRLRIAIDSVIRGTLIIAVLQGIATSIGLAITGIPNAILLGSLAAFGALIPSIGTAIVFVPVVGYLLLTEQYGTAIFLTFWGVVIVGLMDNLLRPILVGRGMRMHPFFILFAVIGGIAVYGMAGFIIGPLILSLLFALLDIFRGEMATRDTLHNHPADSLHQISSEKDNLA